MNFTINVNKKVDWIFHCAAVTTSKLMIEKPVETLSTAIEGTKNILELASKNECKSMVYISSMEMYGTDKPDLRNPLIIKDISKILENTTFGPFKSSIIKAIVVDDIGDKSNSWFNEIVDYALSIGMPGIGYLTLTKDKTFKGVF